jgi:predicted  nucleic acid-binding Zn-ribbon protein
VTLLSSLVELQDIDSELDSARARLEGVRERFGESEEIGILQEEIVNLEAELKTLQSEAKEIDADVSTRREKIAHEEGRLYDGTVRNPKELKGIQQEVEGLRKHLAEQEDAQLALLGRLDELTSSLSSKQADLAEKTATWTAEQDDLRRQEGELEAEIARVDATRQQAAGRVAAPTLTEYDQIRRRRQGKAVARIERGVCTGCRISLPAAVLQRSRNINALVHCPSCERILFLNQ